MNTFKHLIITRFMCGNFIKEDTNIDVNSFQWNEKAYNMAKRHIIPTLENQTDKNFTLVFLVSDDVSRTAVRRIKELSDKLDIEVVFYSNFSKYIKSFDTDYLITSRLDYDDHVYKDCVKDIHKVIKEKPEIKIWGLNSGITVFDGETKAYYQKREDYEINKDGFCAPMLTLILQKDACKKGYFDIYKLGFHIDVVKNFLAVQGVYMNRENYELYDIYYPKDYYGRDIYFIWTRHDNSASYLVFNVIHTSNIKIDITKSKLKRIFGYIPE